MKKFALLSIFLLSLLLGFTLNSSGQTTVWSEDFSAYVENTGIEGPGTVNIGDYPAGVTKWTLDVSNCTLADADDYFKTHNYAKQLEGRDLDGDAVWQSESIDISSYSDVTFSLEASEDGSLNSSDYFDVYYQVDGGGFVRIPNWNGMGNDDHTLVDDFPSTTITQSISSGNQLVIKVVMHNNSTWDRHYLDDISVKANMEYISATTTQNTLNIAAGKSNRQIIGIEIVTTGTESPLSISKFTVNANGSSTPVSNNIENAKLYFTGTDNAFSTDTQFGSTYSSPTSTDFDITGTQQLSEGTNYFWLTFDTKTGATVGEHVDAECISFVIGDSTETPTITAPSGSRTIAEPLLGSYTIGAKSNYTSFTAAANDLNELGISGTVSFAVASGTYTEQISFSVIDGTSATDTIVFQSSTGNRADVTLQFEPTSTANYVVNFDGSDYISFLDMTIQSTGTSSYGRVFVFEGATQNITIKDNNINGLDINSDEDVYAVIYAFSGTTNMATNINIENDSIRYGSNGIYFYGGDDSNLETGNTFINNVVKDFYYCGIDIAYQDAVVINKNRITSKGVSTVEQGIKTYYCNNEFEITQNRVLLSAADENTGIELNSCYGTTALPGLISNNFVSITVASFTTAGIDILNSGHQNIYHNSINTHSAKKSNTDSRSGNQTGVGVTHYWVDVLFEGLQIINNIVSGNLKSIEVSQTTADEGYLESSDHNDWFTLGNILGSWGNTDCADLAAWQAACGMDAGSVDEDPNYISDESPATANENLKESVSRISEVDKDIDNMSRRTMTTPGAKNSCCTWIGTVSTDWNDPNNWCFGHVPTLNDDVCIDKMATYQPDLTSFIDCRDLLLQEGSSLNANNYNMNIYGNVNMTDGIVIADDVISLKGSENTEFMPSSQTYNDLRVNKDSDNIWVMIQSNTDTIKIVKLSVYRGMLEAQRVSVARDADFSGGTVDISKIEFTDTENASFTSGNNTLQSVVINKSGGGEISFQDDLAAAALEVLNGTLQANYNTEISANFTVSTTGNNAVVNVAAGKKLTVGGATTIENGGELRLKSDANGGGHFIPQGAVQRNGTGKVVVEQYFTDGQWHLVSSPVANATVNSLYFNGSPDVWLKKFHESGSPSDWEYITDLSTPMPFGKGFGYWVETPTDVTALFEGDLLTDNLTLNSSSTPPLAFSDIDHGFNLVGNPYSSALDWDIGTWERSNLEGSVWVWQDAGAGDGSGNYLVRNLAGEGSLTDGIIPMCQGFFVRATTSAPVLTIPADARVNSSQALYKDYEREVAPHIILNVSNNENRDEVWIGFDEEMTTAFDYGRDVSKLFGSTDVPQLYLNEQGFQLSIDILPELIGGEERTVTMAFKASTAATHKIIAESLEYLPETDIILEDLKTGILHDLHNNPEYSFAATPQDDADRFLVHFFYLPTAIGNPDDERSNSEVNIYAYDKAVYIKCDGETAWQTGTVSIYDMHGRLLINEDLKSGSLNKIDVAVSNGCVVVRVIKGNVVSTGKVFVR